MKINSIAKDTKHASQAPPPKERAKLRIRTEVRAGLRCYGTPLPA